MSANVKRQVEIFSAGCAVCQETVERVQQLAAAEGHEVRVLDMKDPDVARRAKELGVRSVPAVAVTATKLAACCANRGPDEAVLRAAIAEG